MIKNKSNPFILNLWRPNYDNFLKKGKSLAARHDDDTAIRLQVEKTLADIEAHGDTAIGNLSKQFDDYAPETFRLSDAEIQACIAQVAPRDLEDIKFAQAQVRRFAEVQRQALQDVEIETRPGVILGHKNIPVQSVGCYVPGENFQW